MSNKKLSRLLEPNLKFYFFFMLLFVVVAVPVNWKLALAEAAVTVLLYFYFRQNNQKRRQSVLQYIDSVTGSVDTASKSTLINSPLPTLVFRPDTGRSSGATRAFCNWRGSGSIFLRCGFPRPCRTSRSSGSWRASRRARSG